MTRRKKILTEIEVRKISAIIRTDDKKLAADAMNAAVEGGFRIVEFTLTTPGAFQLITEFRKKDDDLLVGAGTVMSVGQANDAVNAGAQFIVSPVCNPEIISYAVEIDVVSIPGTYTATEMDTAHQLGADMVKLFPAPADIPGYLSAILGPMPYLKIFPTNGVDIDNMLSVLSAGAAGVGFVKTLFNPTDMEMNDFTAIKKRATAIFSRLIQAGSV
ncbi:MAG TPA: bifunctional 4-hydroxy-2-oxoglutarate aldolase/2-dehydro-3-deoxy-phosphogluconate aldolase [Candidatus Marinimicrobia bacterium]|nr:bifunctional 4-hydroxy-2-oxoglutarate aldolase/2-dehydro-3-deoxy-phosphogluconate aldolase [Candidatus Neomarinimicrobiota bacterium]